MFRMTMRKLTTFGWRMEVEMELRIRDKDIGKNGVENLS